MQSGDFASACQKFAESNRLEPALGTRFNLAHCEEQSGHVLAAWTLFRQVRGELPAGDRRIPVADQHIAGLASRLAHLRVIVEPRVAGIVVRVDGVAVDPPDATGTFPIDPGKHQVNASVPGRAEEATSLDFGEGSTIELRIPRERDASPGRRQDSAAPNLRTNTSSERESIEPQRTAAYIAGGAGAVALLVGAVAGIAGLHQEGIGNNNCSDVTRTCNQKGVDANRSARSLATISTVGLAAGVLGVGIGGYLYFAAQPPSRSAAGHGQSAALSVTWSGQW